MVVIMTANIRYLELVAKQSSILHVTNVSEITVNADATAIDIEARCENITNFAMRVSMV